MMSITSLVNSLSETDSLKRVTRCKPWSSYYHPLRVVTFIAMAIRKAIATQLSNAAKALEKDQTKEQAGRLINGIRISLANVIMPNIPLSK
jgi:hypothetical protein